MTDPYDRFPGIRRPSEQPRPRHVGRIGPDTTLNVSGNIVLQTIETKDLQFVPIVERSCASRQNNNFAVCTRAEPLLCSLYERDLTPKGDIILIG